MLLRMQVGEGIYLFPKPFYSFCFLDYILLMWKTTRLSGLPNEQDTQDLADLKHPWQFAALSRSGKNIH